jgi:hypothetical protein
MSLSDIVEGNKQVVLIIAVIVLLGAGLMMVRGKGEAGATAARWYYDLDTGELVAHATFERSPVTLPDGHSAVLAHVYGCGDCEGETFLVYVERTDPSVDIPEIRTGKDGGDTDPGKVVVALTAAAQIAVDPKTTGGEPQWLPASQRAAMSGLANKCGKGQRPRECLPSR